MLVDFDALVAQARASLENPESEKPMVPVRAVALLVMIHVLKKHNLTDEVLNHQFGAN